MNDADIYDVEYQLWRTGRGAKVRSRYAGGLAYAYDIMLLSPTVDGLQAMLDVCGQFAEENAMKFNVQFVSMITRKLNSADPHLQLRDIMYM